MLHKLKNTMHNPDYCLHITVIQQQCLQSEVSLDSLHYRRVPGIFPAHRSNVLQWFFKETWILNCIHFPLQGFNKVSLNWIWCYIKQKGRLSKCVTFLTHPSFQPCVCSYKLVMWRSSKYCLVKWVFRLSLEQTLSSSFLSFFTALSFPQGPSWADRAPARTGPKASRAAKRTAGH